MPLDAYETYRDWFRQHYGRDFICTPEQWAEWCNQPSLDAKLLQSADARTVDILADQREFEREAREGWAR